ncbi:uncharacterized protein B0I36DRAFT_380016 [Microdochium trichocladiopsis]|uniref:Membrane-associated, eicosanoid/glutathione metabolism protein n=1 Tax=Microdochium trichocladiopsis TaxID=1682393 RepID=A0A9P8YIW3_9PEZI|nr:uncharacterized protein B0I36DRAFT_380016 [Microdochium trichocladiopsis]KAH7041209.1 hypothetical protein B0I36DRAFT_380016 [Microdochium trichocladiopsis]
MASGAMGIYTTQFLAPLLPVTGAFALPFTAYFSFLSLRIVGRRLHEKHYVGDTLPSSSSSTSSKSDSKHSKSKSSSSSSSANKLADNDLYTDVRSHMSFIENVPFAFSIAAIAELNGAHPTYLSAALGSLLFFRVLHAEFGLKGKDAMGNGRPVGYFGTIGTIMGLAAYAAGLTREFWMKQLK